MKKRRTNPIPLLSVMVLCLALIGYLNSRNASSDPNQPPPQQQQQQPQQPPPDQAALGKQTTAPSKEDLVHDVKLPGAPSPAEAPSGGPAIMPPGGPAAGTGPNMPARPSLSIKGPQMKPNMNRPVHAYKPKPSDSATSTQWWEDGTNKNTGG